MVASVTDRKALQRILQCGTESGSAASSAVEKFGCPRCHSEYGIIRRQTAPGFIPRCEDCDQEFQTREGAAWLVYERADA